MSTNQIAKRPALDPAILATLSEVSTNATNAFSVASMSTGNVAAALEVAGAIEDLRVLFDRPDIQARIVALQDTAIGFRTDRDPKVYNKKLDGGKGGYNQPYPYPVVKDCAIEATLRGLQLVGNQINIISGRCYVTREGFEYAIKRQRHITNFVPIVSIPRMMNGGCLVDCEASWDNAGTKQAIKVTIPVKSDEYGTADQFIGKATRKLLKRCYEIMTGNVLPEGDAEESSEELALPPTSVAAQITAPKVEPRKREIKSEVQEPPAVTTPAEGVLQNRLAALVAGEGCSFDHFLSVLTQLEPDGSTCLMATGFLDLSDAVATKYLGAQAGLRAALKVAKEGTK